jgi:hypothetical protein
VDEITGATTPAYACPSGRRSLISRTEGSFNIPPCHPTFYWPPYRISTGTSIDDRCFVILSRATSHGTSRGCYAFPLTSSKSSTSSPWCLTPCIVQPRITCNQTANPLQATFTARELHGVMTLRKRYLLCPSSVRCPRGGAGAKLSRQRFRILQLSPQGTLATAASSACSRCTIWALTESQVTAHLCVQKP